MLTYELFEKLILGIQEEYRVNDVINDAIKNAGFSGYIIPGGILSSAVIETLEKLLFDTENEWISYFIYEKDFGRDYNDGDITENGKNIPLRTIQDLWNLLQENIK